MRSVSRLLIVWSLVLLFILPTARQTFGDSLSISTWQTGDALNAVNLNARMNSITTWSTQLANDNLKTSAGVVGSKLDLTSGTGRISHTTSVTSDAPVFTSAQTWDNTSGVFSAWRLTVTNTNSASTSRLLDMRVGSTIIASISRTGQFMLNPQNYASGPTTLLEGAWFNVASATMTDNVTAASGTAPRFIAYAFQRPAVASSNSSVTTTRAASVFIASAPVAGDNMTLTNRAALWVDQGDVWFGGSVLASGSVGITGNLDVVGNVRLHADDTATDGGMTVSGGTSINLLTSTNHALRFFTNNIERARITNSGILALGTTVTTSAAAGDFVLSNNSGEIRAVNAAGTDTQALLSLSNGNNIALGSGLTADSAVDMSGGGATGLWLGFKELSTDAGAAAANGARLYARDNGSGKTQLCVIFQAGATQCFATEP